jgi:FtsH-binding integral membrane protein
MSYDSQNPWTARRGGVATQGEYDLGLRQYMLRVYNYMASGLAVTGVVAWLAYDTGITAQLRHSPLMWLVVLAPLALVLIFSAGLQRMSFSTAQMVYWGYAALMGLSVSTIFLAYNLGSIATTFFVTATMFLGMSLYGYTTKADLTRMGSFMMMGLIGIIIASFLNFFLHSAAIVWATSIIGVIVFTGLTAWDTQRIAQQYYMTAQESGDVVGKSALMGALQLYLDFLNLFMLLLRFFGNSRD